MTYYFLTLFTSFPSIIFNSGDIGFFIGATSTGTIADLSNLDVAMHSNAGVLFAATTWFSIRQFYLAEKIKNSDGLTVSDENKEEISPLHGRRENKDSRA